MTSHSPSDKPRSSAQDKLPLRMLHDRILVAPDQDSSERRSSSGIVIPATAVMGKRLAWAEVVAAGPQVRQVAVGDRVLFDPEDRAEVEVNAADYTLLRERDIHAVSQPEEAESSTGLYL